MENLKLKLKGEKKMRNKKESKVFVKRGNSPREREESENKIYALQSSGYKRLSDNGKTVILQRIR